VALWHSHGIKLRAANFGLPERLERLANQGYAKNLSHDAATVAVQLRFNWILQNKNKSPDIRHGSAISSAVVECG
jgi:hypothetical protein